MYAAAPALDRIRQEEEEALVEMYAAAGRAEVAAAAGSCTAE